jgi:hypothetical protein
MKYTTEFDGVNGICIIRVKGKLRRPDDSITLQKFVRNFYIEQGCCRFLIDMRQAQIIGGKEDTFSIGTIPVDTDLKMKTTPHKVALVYSSTNVNEIFLENVAVSRGYNIKVFTKIDKAIEWFKTD